MFKSILAAVDSSKYGPAVVEQAIALGRRKSGKVLVLHVVDNKRLEGAYLSDLVGMLGLGPFLDVQTQLRQQLEDKGRVLLEMLLERCTQAGVPADSALSYGPVPAMIAQAAKQADLVVLGRGGEHDHLGRSLFGSTLEATVRQLNLPCMIVTEAAAPPRKLLLAYDGSPHASAALKLAASLMEEDAAELSVVWVDDGSGLAVLAEAREYLQTHGIEARFLTKSGPESEVILACAQELGAEAILMGAYSHSHLRDLFLGSTTSEVVQTSELPVFLCR